MEELKIPKTVNMPSTDFLIVLFKAISPKKEITVRETSRLRTRVVMELQYDYDIVVSLSQKDVLKDIAELNDIFNCDVKNKVITWKGEDSVPEYDICRKKYDEDLINRMMALLQSS